MSTYVPQEISPATARSFEWVTRDGGEMTLGEMTDSHLINLEKWLVRRIEALEAEHDHQMLMILDVKAPTSFSGTEDALERCQYALRCVSIERAARCDRSSSTD